MMNLKRITLLVSLLFLLISFNIEAQIGTRFPSEKKVITDPVTGTELVFLTSTPAGDSKIYPTHNQWTSDGEWIIFRSNSVRGEAMAVNEKSGDIVQVTEGGFFGTLDVARKSMKLYYMKMSEEIKKFMEMRKAEEAKKPEERKKPEGIKRPERKPEAKTIIEVDLAKLFADSEAGTIKDESEYQRIVGTIPAEFDANADMALDANEDWIYFRVGKEEAMKHLPEGTELKESFGPRNMGAGPGGIAAINVLTGEVKYVVSVPFQVGHIQTNSWIPGQIAFCWETGGKSPQRTWIVNSDGSGLRPLYPESDHEWITHEVVISADEVAFAIMGHREIPGIDSGAPEGTGVKGANPGQETEWGDCGTREKPTGLGIVNIKTREMTIAGQIPYGSGFWHVAGSSDGRFVAGDNFARELYLIDRHTHEMILLTAGHKQTAQDHVHPTFNADGTKIQIQSAMLSEDGKSMNICVVPLPEEWLQRRKN